ncbi:hypothetical protein MPSEU_000599600 [Mayamaea pseudoterrestris]|nr:hypothetical protein MPSEU_000599600 [Mayamaea pseudoterrestris]GKY96401.1 hypothetical protein MPSEU_000599600 [Mayamaea pseudoterrestris]
MKELEENSQGSSGTKDGMDYIDDNDVHLDEHSPGLKSSSTTLSTASETSDGSFLPSFSNDSDSASRDEEQQVFLTTTSSSDVLRHRRDPAASVPLSFSPPCLLQYASPPASCPVDGYFDNDYSRSRCTIANDQYPAAACPKSWSIHQGLIRVFRLILVLGFSFLLANQFWSHSSVMVGTNPQLNWRIPASRRLVRKMVRRIQQQQQHDHYSTSTSFTILLRATRIDLLQSSVDRHASCPNVESVQIDWQGDPDEELPAGLMQHKSGKVREPVTDEVELTNAVLLLEEGLEFSCQDLQRAHHEWQRDPVRVVGLVSETNENLSLVSDKAVFVHKLLLLGRPKRDAKDNLCREFVLSAFLTMATARSSVPMISKPKRLIEVEQQASKQQELHCVSLLAKAFGLKQTSLQAQHHYVGL